MPRGNIEGIYHAQKRSQHEDVPHLHDSGKGEGGKNRRQDHRRNLGADHQTLAVETVGDDPSERRHQEYRKLAGESRGPQQQGGSGQAINQPRLCNGLHPGADQGDELPAEEKLEVAMAQGAQGCR